MKNSTKIRKRGMLYQFTMIFTIITLLMVIISFFLIYNIQIYENNQNAVKTMNTINAMLSDEIINDGDNFIAYKKYMSANFDRISIYPENNWKTDKNTFDEAFKKEYPGKIYGEDILFDDMDRNLKDLYVIWYHEYWMDRFNYYEERFNSPSVYFVYPNGDGSHVVYMIDFETLIEKDANGRFLLWDNYDEDPEEMKYMFKTWNIGEEIPEYDVFDNEYGRSYSKYLPVYINGEKIGMVCSDTNIDNVFKDTMLVTIQLIIIETLIWFLGINFIIFYIKIHYIKRINNINILLEEYGRERSEDVIKAMQNLSSKKNDEIDGLIKQVVYMLNHLCDYVEKIMSLSAELNDTKSNISLLKGLAESDTLSGLGNKYAYKKKEQMLNKEIANNTARFAVILIDLNYLKKINDTYGHEKGDIAIKKLSEYIEKFFGKYNTYRIGGDEFVIILDAVGTSETVIHMFNTIDEELSKDTSLNPWEKISFAKGFSIYLPGLDTCVEDVFKRADESMYRNKTYMKANRT